MALSATAILADTSSLSSAELDQYEGLLIDSLVIENRNIFDLSSQDYDAFIYRTANKFHLRTRKNVIGRELLLAKGQLFDPELAEETTRNLRSLNIIYDAWIEAELLDNNRLFVTVITVDVWSLSGGVSISRDGNEDRLRLGVKEKNFLGRNQRISFDYVIEEQRPNYAIAEFFDRRFLGAPMSVGLLYDGNSEGGARLLTLGKPFYNLSQALAVYLTVASTFGHRDIFNNDVLIASSHNTSDRTNIAVNYRTGTRHRPLIVGAGYEYVFHQVNARQILSADSGDIAAAFASFPSDSLYHMPSVVVSYSILDFVKQTYIDGFGHTEDFTMGAQAKVRLGRAFGGVNHERIFDFGGISFSYGKAAQGRQFFTQYSQSRHFIGKRLLRRRDKLQAEFYRHGPSWLTLALRGVYVGDKEEDGGDNLTLGGRSGLRAYPTEFRTGDRLAVMNWEARLYPGIKIMSVDLGGAVFVDGGRTWKSYEALDVRDLYFSGGAGIRISLDRSARSKFLRFDLAWSSEHNWEISLGTGPYFKASTGETP
jgi:hypothetical protein